MIDSNGRHAKYDLNITLKGVVVKAIRFNRIHCKREALYEGLFRVHWIDDEEVLLQLGRFSATLTPLFPAVKAFQA